MVGRALVFAVAVPFALGKGCQLAPTDTAPDDPVLTVSEDVVEWEDARLDTLEEIALEVGNEGPTDMSLSLSVTGDASFSVVEGADSVAAGGTVEVRLGFTAPGYLARSGRLVLVTDDPETPRVEVALRGLADPDQDDDGQDAVAAGGMDCDDSDATVYDYAVETCNGVDDDCDGFVDEDASDSGRWYRDWDGDGHGDPDATQRACDPPEGYVSSHDDCDDLESDVFPGADETCNRRDDDCDDEVDEDAVDASTWFTDADGDGHGDPATAARSCTRPGTAVLVGDDCDDADPDVYSGC